MVKTLKPKGPGLDVSGCLIAEASLLALGQRDLHLGGDGQGDLVLNGEDVFNGAVEALGPYMRSVV